jgi:hypothetical protein
MQIQAFTKVCAIILLSVNIAFGQNNETKSKSNGSPGTAPNILTKYSFKIINAPDNTFGYDIYADNKLTIHQPSIPGVGGLKGFNTRLAAEKTAKLVIQKMEKGEMPPTVTTGELQKLKVL